MNEQPGTPAVQSLESKLSRFQDEHFGELCKRLRILLGTGQVDSACEAIRQFAGERNLQPLSPGTSIQACGLPIRLANALEKAGYQTLGSLSGVTEEQLLRVRGCSHGAVEKIREVLREMLKQRSSQRSALNVKQQFVATPERVVRAPRDYRGVKSGD